MSKIERALVFAYKAHGGQVRKYTGEPYICHPIAVAAILQELDYDEDCIQAALLHDVVEDTEYTNNDIKSVFGTNVAKLVAEVTDVSRLEDGNRAVRKELDRQHIARASPYGKDIKLADLIDNTRSISQHDKNFAKTYLAEKKLLLEVMGNANPLLLRESVGRLEDIERIIKQHDALVEALAEYQRIIPTLRDVPDLIAQELSKTYAKSEVALKAAKGV